MIPRCTRVVIGKADYFSYVKRLTEGQPLYRGALVLSAGYILMTPRWSAWVTAPVLSLTPSF